MLPVEAMIKFFDWQKVYLIAWLFPSEALYCLISKGQGSDCSSAFLIVDFSSSEVTLIPWSAPKRAWSLDSYLIPVASTSTWECKWLPLELFLVMAGPWHSAAACLTCLWSFMIKSRQWEGLGMRLPASQVRGYCMVSCTARSQASPVFTFRLCSQYWTQTKTNIAKTHRGDLGTKLAKHIFM